LSADKLAVAVTVVTDHDAYDYELVEGLARHAFYTRIWLRGPTVERL
jgi:hypothetical protein